MGKREKEVRKVINLIEPNKISVLMLLSEIAISLAMIVDTLNERE